MILMILVILMISMILMILMILTILVKSMILVILVTLIEDPCASVPPRDLSRWFCPPSSVSLWGQVNFTNFIIHQKVITFNW